jgi:hypothetical protein
MGRHVQCRQMPSRHVSSHLARHELVLIQFIMAPLVSFKAVSVLAVSRTALVARGGCLLLGGEPECTKGLGGMIVETS